MQSTSLDNSFNSRFAATLKSQRLRCSVYAAGGVKKNKQSLVMAAAREIFTASVSVRSMNRALLEVRHFAAF